jgi:tetratricopeptide (TPR) repeat protein
MNGSSLISLAVLFLGILVHGNSVFASEVDQADKQMANNSVAMDHFIRGVIADKMEDYYRAVFEYQGALEADPQSPFLYVALAQDYMILGKVPQALDLLAKALEIEADYLPALELRAGLLANTDRWPEALTLYEHLARLDTTQVEYPFQLLRLYLMNRDFDSADTMYQRVVAVQGESKQLLFQVATTLLLSESPLRAIPYMEHLSRMDTADAAVIYTLGTLYLLRADTVLAQTNFERAVAMDSSVARYWMGLAILQMDRNNYVAAHQTLMAAVAEIPTDAGLWNLLGTCQNREGKTDEAIRSLQETLRLDSTNYSALGILALIYDRSDSVEKVQELYERALQLSDSAAVFLNNYAYTLSERGTDLNHAKAMAEKACAAEPTNASFLDTMGWIFFKMGDHKSAIRWLEKARKSEPHSAPILEHLGDVYQDRGAHSKARAYYRKALKWDPNNETLRRKLGI